MAEELTEEQKISAELREKFEKIAKENDEAQEKDRERVEKATAAQAEVDAAHEKRLRDYQLGRVAATDDEEEAVSAPESASKSAAGPVEEVAAEQAAEAEEAPEEEKPAPKKAAAKKPAAKKAAAKKSD